jgi:hypothetical protein
MGKHIAGLNTGKEKVSKKATEPFLCSRVRKPIKRFNIIILKRCMRNSHEYKPDL